MLSKHKEATSAVLLFLQLMQGILQRMKQHAVFFTGYLVLLVAGIMLLLSEGKRNSFILLNRFHFSWLDQFFIRYTNAGDGIFAILLALFFFFVLRKRNLGLTLLIGYSFSGILAQIIKPLVESPRPETYFAPQWLPFFIKGVIHTGRSSFPSGHTVTAFVLAAVLTLYTNNKILQLLLLLLATAVGFSRIYLSQHFLTDVLAGSFIGVTIAVWCTWWLRNVTDDKLLYRRK